MPKQYPILMVAIAVICSISATRLAVSADRETPNEASAAQATDDGGITAGGLDLIDDIWDLLNSVSTRINTAITRATEARDRAIEARDRATQARDDAAEMVSNMQDGMQHLTGEMRDRIQDAVDELGQALQQELAGAEDFTNGPNSCSPTCEGFRADLIALLTSLEDITNAILATSAIDGQVDFSAEMDFVESLNGKALFPLYRVFQSLPILDEDFLASMSRVAADLEEVAMVIADPVAARGVLPDVCETLAGNDELLSKITTAAGNIDKVGKGAKIAGAKLSAIGKTKIAGRVGVWGWAGVSYSGGLLERFGGHLESLGKHLTPIAEKVEKKLQYCVLKVNTRDILEMVESNHEEIADSQQEILEAIKALPHGNGADLNADGAVNLGDYSMFQNAFGSMGG